METKDLKRLSLLPYAMLTPRLVALAQEILRYQDEDKGLASFSWEDVRVDADASLHLSGVDTVEFTEDVRTQNLWDYAAIVYCIATGNKSAESMGWDAGEKIKQPVLREIVQTICGHNTSVEPLIAKLHQPYTGEDAFFSGYTTVEGKEAEDAYRKARDAEYENYRAENEERIRKPLQNSPSTSWGAKIGFFILAGLIISGVKLCNRADKAAHDAAVEELLKIPSPNSVPSIPLGKVYDTLALPHMEHINLDSIVKNRPNLLLRPNLPNLDSMMKNRPNLNIEFSESFKAHIDSLKRLREEYTRDNEALPRTDSESATKASPDSIK